MNNTEAISKAISTSMITTGLLSPEQAGAFVRQVFDSTPLLSASRRVAMGARKMNIDKIGVGARLLRVKTEGSAAPLSNAVNTGQIVLDAVSLSLPWEITEDAIRYNIEGERFEETVIGLMTRQVGVDLNDLAWNGNATPPTATTLSSNVTVSGTSLPVVAASAYPTTGVLVIDNERILYTGRTGNSFTGLTRGYDGTTAASHSSGASVALVSDFLLSAFNGWLQQASTAHTVDGSNVGEGAMDKGQFKAMLSAMPVRYLATASAKGLRWIMHPRTAFAYLDSLTDRATSGGDYILMGADGKSPYGYPILEDPALPTGTVVFTDPRNLVLGMALDIRISRDASSKDVISRGVRYYQIDLAADAKIEEPDALVLNTGITV